MPNSASISATTTSRLRTIALAGNPNTGKTTLFNALTGYRQRVGNYPGVTVEKRTGRIRGGRSAVPLELIDLPGTYSLAAHSLDEAVVMDVLLGNLAGVARPDLIVVVVDAAHLARNLFFTTQILEIGLPVVVALNMMDVAEDSGVQIDADRLSHELGVPVVPVIATRQSGLASLTRAIVTSLDAHLTHQVPEFPACIRVEVAGLADSLGTNGNGRDAGALRIEALQTLLGPDGIHERRAVKRFGPGLATELQARRQRIQEAGESLIEVEARTRYGWIDRVVQDVVTRGSPMRRPWSDRVDRVLTHPVWGMLVFIVAMAFCFQTIYTWAVPLIDGIDRGITALGGLASHALPEGPLQSLVVNGVIAGVGAVLAFLPQILILFLFLAVLEDCGYMARSAFLLDRWMGFLGLNGKSFIPLLSSFACAVPGILATRTIEDRRDRLVTILVAPLMSCSARLPVYILMIGAFIPATPLLGRFLNLQAATLLGLYFIGAVVAVPVALILKHTILKGKSGAFLMELPTYKWPSIRTVFFRAYDQGKAFCVSAGTIIFSVTIIVWALGYYPHPAAIAAKYDAHRTALRESRAVEIGDAPQAGGFRRSPDDGSHSIDGAAPSRHATASDATRGLTADAASHGRASTARAQSGRVTVDWEARLHELDQSESGDYLRQSILGRLGRWIEPVVRPLGWDWKIGTAAIASFPAREVVIATMGTIYNLGDKQDARSAGLRQKLREATWPDGRPVFNVAVALSIMVFFALCCQCGGTLAVIRRETGSWRWPIFTFTYMTALAYAASFATYQIAFQMMS